MFSIDRKYDARKKRALSFKHCGFQKRGAGRVSGMLGTLAGVRKGCTCCDPYNKVEKRRFKRIERTMWLNEWQDEQDSEIRE